MSITLESLSNQLQALKLEVASLREAQKPTKATPSKKAKDPDAPKKEATWWIKATVQIREMLKPTIDEHNSSLASGEKKLAGTVPTTVGSMLKAKGQLDKDTMPTLEQVVEAFEAYLENPPEPKGPALRAAAEAKKASSVSSGSSVASEGKARKPRGPMSEEKKAAMLAKRAATKAAKEAAAAPAPAPAPEAEEVVEEVTAAAPAEETVQAYKWMGKIGKDKKEKAYERIDYAGKSYIYVFTEEGDGNYLGAMVGTSTTLDMTVPDIRSETTEE
jgi:hypothetical protein